MKHGIKIISLFLFGIILFICGFFFGRFSMKTEETETFYATIKDVQESEIDVKGLDVNDLNYRGDFSLEISNRIKVEWRGEDHALSGLKQGDWISVTFSGDILETDPAVITEVQKICLLNDK